MRLAAVVVATFTAFIVVGSGTSSPKQTLPIRKTTVTVKKETKSAAQACPGTFRRMARHQHTSMILQHKLGRKPTMPSFTPIRSCLYATWVENRWWKRSIMLKQEVRRRVIPATNDWQTAVRIVQRAFPDTESWLLSCSAAEGGHGRWVRYGGGSYYPGYEHTDAVGNWLQYRWSTFRGHYRNGLDSLRQRGFIVNLPSPDDVRAWLAPTAAAIAGGWARWSGNDNSHWSASWTRGCR